MSIRTKYIIVTGGNMSGLGKGTAISSIGVLLLTKNILLTTIKIDPYLNIDAGTMSPYEHGEVFVLEDGGEVDLDLGNYERFLNVRMSHRNNITSGKVYETVIRKERKGEYLGKTVQMVPHVTDCIKNWIKEVNEENLRKIREENRIPEDLFEKIPCVCLIEVGGTVGDIESSVYLEALQQLINNLDTEDTCLCHLSYVPIIGALGEQKTKPTQHSVKILREAGLRPDFIFCRCEEPLTKEAIQKISLFSQVKNEHVISLHDTSNIYKVPLILEKQNFSNNVLKKLQLEVMVKHNTFQVSPYSFNVWEKLSERYENPKERVVIGIVGKYTGSNDTYLSIISALVHACLECGYQLIIKYICSSHLVLKKRRRKGHTRAKKMKKQMEGINESVVEGVPSINEESTNSSHCAESEEPAGIEETCSENEYSEKTRRKYEKAWSTLQSVDGVLVPGGFGSRGIEGKYVSSRFCRLQNKPYLGICLGMQTAIIDVARSFLNPHASSEEFEELNEPKVEGTDENLVDLSCSDSNSDSTIDVEVIEEKRNLAKTQKKMRIEAFENKENYSNDPIENNNVVIDMANPKTNKNSHDQMNELQTFSKEYSSINHEKMNEILSEKIKENKLQEKIKQLGIDEYYKNLDEIDTNNVIISMDEFKGEHKKGGTMRLGTKQSQIVDTDSLVYQLYDQSTYIFERHRHRFEINPKYVPLLESVGLNFVAKDIKSTRMEICEIKTLDFFVGVQFHPEFTSRPFKANPIFLAFILACKKKLRERLQQYDNKLCSGILFK